MKLAIARKTGYLSESWVAFCIKGKMYSYVYNDQTTHSYSVMTELFKSCCHRMTDDFFNKHFKKLEFIERKEFLIYE